MTIKGNSGVPLASYPGRRGEEMNKITIGNKTQYAWPPPRPGYKARVPPHSSQISQWLQLIPLWLLISERSYLAIFVTAQRTTYSFRVNGYKIV